MRKEPVLGSFLFLGNDLAGTVNSPIEGIDLSERKDITSVTTGTYLSFNLNPTGQDWISKTGSTKLALREGHDVINSAFVGSSGQYNQLQIRTSEYSGTTYDPILEVTYTTPPSSNTTTYTYDSSGQRVKVMSEGVTTVYPTSFYNTDGTDAIKHIMAGGVLATVKGTGASAVVYTASTDHLTGSNTVTSSTGTLTELMDYYPFGAIRLDEKAETFSEQRKFAGHEYDAVAGLTYMNARYYDGEIGRFLSQDPLFWGLDEDYLLDPQLWNSYTYARNNPMVITDPTGLIPNREEAAIMATQIYESGKEGDNLINGWTYQGLFAGGQNMKMGIYYRAKGDNAVEFSLVNKGTSTWGDLVEDVRQLFGNSVDMSSSIEYATEFVSNHPSSEITFIGHSKGGAEAAANAIINNKNAILFNPAAVNLSGHESERSAYSGKMTAYVVNGEIVNNLEKAISKPIDQVIYMPTQHSVSWLTRTLIGPFSVIFDINNSFKNHSRESVMKAVYQLNQ